MGLVSTTIKFGCHKHGKLYSRCRGNALRLHWMRDVAPHVHRVRASLTPTCFFMLPYYAVFTPLFIKKKKLVKNE